MRPNYYRLSVGLLWLAFSSFVLPGSRLNAEEVAGGNLAVAARPAPILTSALTAQALAGQPFAYQITASNEPNSYSATGLPAGLTCDATTGIVSGTPAVAETCTVTLGAANAGGTGSAQLTLTVVAAEAASGNLVGHWKFDETAGTTASDAAHGAAGTLMNGFTFAAESVPGQVGGALNFHGDHDYVNLGCVAAMNFAGTQPYTIAAWVKPGTESETGIILAHYNGNVNAQYYLALSGNRIWMYRNSSASNLFGNTQMSPAWHHVTGIYDGTNVMLYLDGVADAVPTAFDPVGNYSTNVLIGTYAVEGVPATNDHLVTFSGAIDDLRVYNRALNTEEIHALMSAK